MIHVCTHCDNKYLLKGLALYESLVNTMTTDGFMLHWLCIDDLTYKTLSDLKLINVHIYNLPVLEDTHLELRKAKNNPKSNYGDQYSQYCWTLTPWFIAYLLKTEKPEKLLYADADIYFYYSPLKIFGVMGEAAVAIHTHRFSGTIEQQPKLDDGIGTRDIDAGWYNVGVMAFQNSPAAINIAETWKGWVMDITNPFYKEYGLTGDQKYLELFKPLFGDDNVYVFDNPQSTNLTHLAPWCPELKEISPLQVVAFYHFSHFNYDLDSNTWKDSHHGEWNPSTYPGIRKYYEDYFEAIKRAAGKLILANYGKAWNAVVDMFPGATKMVEKTSKKINAEISNTIPTTVITSSPDFRVDIVGCIKVDESKEDRVKMLLASIRSLAFLKNNARFCLLIENASANLYTKVRAELLSCGFDFLLMSHGVMDYGLACLTMLKTCNAPYVMTFLEDHFCVMDDIEQFAGVLATMEKLHVDLVKTSFHEVERNSLNTVELFYSDENGYVYDNTIVNHRKYCSYYGNRYYMSIHFLATRAFAQRFFSQARGVRPHEFEIKDYMPGWEHRVMVPKRELLCSIDDPHGQEGSNLLGRLDQSKFEEIYSSL